MPRKPKVKTKPVQLPLFRLKLYFLLIPLAVAFAGFIFLTSVNKEQALKAGQVACCIPDFTHTGEFESSEKTAYFDGYKVPAPEYQPSYLAQSERAKQVLGLQTSGERWIEVDLSEQVIKAWEGEQLFLESPISTGKRWTPTPVGEFTIWYKTKAQKMSGGTGASYYYLPNVPYIMFFENEQVSGYRGYSLHGTYWHNNFGNQMSHGCVNLPTPIAEQLYYWTQPDLIEGKNIVRASSENPGTRIVIHE